MTIHYCISNLKDTINDEINDLKDTIKDLKNENIELRERLNIFESRLRQMWFSPGMPGAEVAKVSYKSQETKRGKGTTETKYNNCSKLLTYH